MRAAAIGARNRLAQIGKLLLYLEDRLGELGWNLLVVSASFSPLISSQ